MLDFAALKRDALIRAFRQHLEGEVRFDDTTRRLYSTDASIYEVEPLGVVLPKTAEDLVAAVQIAAELETPIVPRGGGTSLSGQSIGPGVVIDCSKYLNQILEIDPVGRTARVQPGVVLDQLNRALARHDLQFGPDVATANRANLGGMIGNNSAGSRSIVYGKTGDHVRRLHLLLSDGSRLRAEPLSADGWRTRAEAPGLEGAIYRRLPSLLTPHAAEIRRRFPNIIRRVSGYNLVDSLPACEAAGSQLTPGLIPLLVGSEGTLGMIAEAELDLVPRPAVRGLLVPQFSSLAAALDALAVCLEFGPSAVELLDAMLIELARGNLKLRGAMAAIQGKPSALLMVEFQSNRSDEVADRVDKLRRKLASFPGVTAIVPALDPAIRDPLWNLRRAAVPLLYGLPGDRKPITFVEDTAVAPERLPEFALQFREILRKHDADGCFYGHASVGCLHIRPVLNLKDPAGVAKMRQIAEEITDLVLAFHGSLSGEHGDGLVRSGWNRKMFGPEVYELFRQVKRLFDPQNLMNPGKVVDAPAMTENLRTFAVDEQAARGTIFHYDRQEGFFRSIELCNGAGVCRKTQGGAMCPSYRATRDERDTTRGRANALRIALNGRLPHPDGAPLAERWLHEVMDLCLMCKACKTECPSNVDLAKLKAEFLHAYYEKHPRPLGHRLLAHVHRLLRWSAPAAPIVNWMQRQRWSRWAMELIAGIDRRRSLPPVHADHFHRWFRRHSPDRRAGRAGKVILLDDCFTNWQEPEIGRAAVRVLERAGYAVELADLECCGRAMISKGFLLEARKLAQTALPKLAARVADGTPILGLEPSCLLTLADEWTELVPGVESERVAAACDLADAFLARKVSTGEADLPLARREGQCLLHTHCHQAALRGSGGSVAALRLIPGWTVTALDAGCCGMAGSFGYEAAHFDLSAQIAGLQLLPALAADPGAVVAATGTSCRHQIRDLAERRARHPLELIDECVIDASAGGHTHA